VSPVDHRRTATRTGWLTALNTEYHRVALTVFMVVVIAHWAEHIAQAYQLWVQAQTGHYLFGRSVPNCARPLAVSRA
jgi:hypothetical protein